MGSLGSCTIAPRARCTAAAAGHVACVARGRNAPQGLMAHKHGNVTERAAWVASPRLANHQAPLLLFMVTAAEQLMRRMQASHVIGVTHMGCHAACAPHATGTNARRGHMSYVWPQLDTAPTRTARQQRQWDDHHPSGAAAVHINTYTRQSRCAQLHASTWDPAVPSLLQGICSNAFGGLHHAAAWHEAH